MKILISLCLFFNLTFALPFNAIHSTMEQNIHKSLQILQTSQESTEAIAQKIFAIFDDIFESKGRLVILRFSRSIID